MTPVDYSVLVIGLMIGFVIGGALVALLLGRPNR